MELFPSFTTWKTTMYPIITPPTCSAEILVHVTRRLIEFNLNAVMLMGDWVEALKESEIKSIEQ